MAKITAPDADYIGKRAGVAFIDGVGETDDVNAIAYFKRHGYKVEVEESARSKGSARASKS
ncbi:hypothetical protein [Nocardioides sp. YIM 152315]|uniref:hypothetical protein n=1 Tax=Nocardioides sp. YIM 152315 TaxID=3031760 RepID=UPI0023DCDA20|nr:hypothetical protein [Nocardioides sp. YIM 152315]MDF1603392.1 hypothetical protein [Nocardioides sp. YIM 152315]